MENWRPAKGYEGQFLVSDEGRVMNAYGHIVKTHFDDRGNLSVCLQDRNIKVAYLVAKAFVPNPESLQGQSYKDGDKSNCKANNVIWITPDYSNDQRSTPVALIKDGIVTYARSMGEARRLIGCADNSIPSALRNPDKMMLVKGYAVSHATDTERIERYKAIQLNPVPNLPDEEWKFIEESDKYMISNKGRFKSLRGHIPRLMNLTRQKRGYYYASTMKDGKVKLYRIHRLVAKAFLPNPDNLPEVNHIDGNTHNNDVSNLEWCTREYNLNDEGKRQGWKRRERQ